MSYEQLMELGERMGNVSNGIQQSELQRLPERTIQCRARVSQSNSSVSTTASTEAAEPAAASSSTSSSTATEINLVVDDEDVEMNLSDDITDPEARPDDIERQRQQGQQCKEEEEKDENAATEQEECMCAICFDSYEQGDVVRCLPCHHEFHSACIDKWLENKSTCPVCMTDVRQGLRTLLSLP
eukprot:Filipodium_phascolosomae@DN1168_c0_g1_i2.p1